MTHWEKLHKELLKHLLFKRGCGRSKRMRDKLGIKHSSMDNWIHRGRTPSYERGMELAEYLKNPVPDPVKAKDIVIDEKDITIDVDGQRSDETYYSFILRTGQIQ